MTNEEASFLLANADRSDFDEFMNEALDIAIKLLDQLPDIKAAYDKGYKDGQEALAFHLELCKEEQEPCEDCISFPKGTLKKRGKGYVVYNPEWLKENWQTELKVMGIDPSVQPKTGHWIPVSEKMPEDGEECIITIRERWGEDVEWDYEEPTTAYYQNGKWSPSYDVDEGQEWEVIAWMPLPTEPYKPTDLESEDKE